VTTSFGSRYDWAYAVALQTDGKIVLAGETNPVQFYDIAIARYLSTLHVGIIDEPLYYMQGFVYPNPIAFGSFTIEYELQREEAITITLWDITGRNIVSFLDDEKRNSGKQKENLVMPQYIADGNYLLQIKTHTSITSVKVIKR